MDLVGEIENSSTDSKGMSLEEAREYLLQRGLDAFILGGADTIARMQGIDRLR